MPAGGCDHQQEQVYLSGHRLLLQNPPFPDADCDERDPKSVSERNFRVPFRAGTPLYDECNNDEVENKPLRDLPKKPAMPRAPGAWVAGTGTAGGCSIRRFLPLTSG
jgi:hypothetical protein